MLILVYLAIFLFFLLHIFPSFPFLLLFLCPIIPTGLLPPSGVVCKVFSPPPPASSEGNKNILWNVFVDLLTQEEFQKVFYSKITLKRHIFFCESALVAFVQQQEKE